MRRWRPRRAWTFVVLALLAAALGCTRGAPGELTVSGHPGPCWPGQSVSGGGELTVALGQDISDGQTQTQLITDWANACGMRPDIVELSPDTDLARATYVAAAQGEAPYPFDLIIVDTVDVPALAERGYLRPLSVPEDRLTPYPRSVVAGDRYDDRLYALPYTANVGLLYYRRDVLGGDPRLRDWQDIARACRRSGRLRDDRHGCLVTQLAPYEGMTVNALEAAWSEGGSLFAPDDDVTGVQATGKKTAAGLERLVGAGSGTGGVISGASRDAKEKETIKAFTGDDPRAALMRTWPYAYEVLCSDYHMKPGEDFGVVPLPWPSVQGGESVAVPATTTHPQAALALARVLSGIDGTRIPHGEPSRPVLPQEALFAEGGLAAARTDVYRRVHTRSCASPYDARFAGYVAASIRRARPRPVTPAYPRVSFAIQSTISGWLRSGHADPAALDQAIEDAQ